MGLGISGGGTRSYRQRYPSMQGPDVVEGGGGGGGTPPTAPSNITTVGTAYKVICWGGYGHAYTAPSAYTTWKNSMGMVGHAFAAGGKYLYHAGGGNDYIGSSAAGLSGSQYNYQKAFQGIGVPSVNGGNTNLGPFIAKNTVGFETYLGFYVHASTQTNGGLDASGAQTHPPLGDVFNDTNWALYAADMGGVAGFVSFMGGTGITMDLEAGATGNDWRHNPKAGQTAATTRAKYEERGYQCGQAIWGAFPNCSLMIYIWRPPGAWFRATLFDNGAGTTPPDADTNMDQFVYGLMRAMKDANSNGRFAFWDPQFYKPTSQISGMTLSTALKINAERALAGLSYTLPAATRNYIIPRFNMELAVWAGSDGTAFYSNATGTSSGHTAEPMYTQQHATFKLYSMGGRRHEYLGPTAAAGIPSGYSIVGVNNAYMYASATPNPPGNHLAGYATNALNNAHPNTTAPALSASKSGSGSTRSITATASHEYGMHWCRAYVYPSGTPIYLVGAWNNGGGSTSTNFNNSYVSYTGTITATTGQYIIVQAQSIMGHQTSRVLAA